MPLDRSHIVKSYEQELGQLRSMMARMGGIVENQVALALSAIADRNEEAADAAARQDPEVDELEREVEALAIRLLALRSPMAGDLREIVAALKITGDLERIGDYAASIARRSLKIRMMEGQISLSGLRSMGRLVQDNLRRSIDAITQQDSHRAMEVWHSDRAVDEYYTALFRELVTYMIEDARNIRTCTELLFIAKNLERIGDHATNIAERVFYAVTGENLPALRPRGGAAATATTEISPTTSSQEPDVR
ncbi:phosphate signaling complex protein PhoU [Gluconobacter wancherniae]|uniref:Phosphate-specific transport system accessory protein PhoU n=1 Tax=Gluconobacter wancherniae NBRC 103581 TaxID=656744 RepID=A0A511B2J0_9PROT|nr:phosphate signaling complex protein PhoU [Gluconobacter wancherniae]MBF0854766.1 phosphate signaling complex protein PhoU [Gluconobacter wancherniae]MBS1063518.1 phosphate signaling complex protein PhoU [Gluconobacter wancherniae]MBS1089345.1 phosphate signaling complex protein PhoU [Gluconobacter wancherniae]GBD57837.1 phosphate-specific transport system accessory protein PhoU [Gluconobacter wancherniae NBRC 103581]GBR61956.1 transcriptional regulator for phosphate uptake PhoU [Gluconobact